MRGLWRLCLALVLLAAGCLVLAGGAFAQVAAPALEVAVGHAAFVNDTPIHHVLTGGTLRWPVTARLGIGPEVSYMIGPALTGISV